MIYYKLSRLTQNIGTVIAAGGAFGAGLSLALTGFVNSGSIRVSLGGIVVFIIGLAWEIALDMLNEERENKRAIKRYLKRIDENEKSA